MGAKRLPREIRSILLEIAKGLEPAYTSDTGEVDVRGLAAATERALERDRPRTFLHLQDTATRMMVDSALADKYRDSRVEVRVKGKVARMRNFYRVPGANGEMVAKEMDALTPEDLDYLEGYYYKEAMSRLSHARGIRGLKGEIISGAHQESAAGPPYQDGIREVG